MARVLRLLWIVIKSGHSYLSTSDKYMVIYVWHSRLCECQGVKMVVTRNKPGVNMFVYCVSSTTLSSIAHLHCQEPLKLNSFNKTSCPCCSLLRCSSHTFTLPSWTNFFVIQGCEIGRLTAVFVSSLNSYSQDSFFTTFFLWLYQPNCYILMCIVAYNLYVCPNDTANFSADLQTTRFSSGSDMADT